MKVETFYHSACEALSRERELIHDKTRPLVLRDAVKVMCENYKSGMSEDQILSKLSKKLEEEYEPSWFALDWQKKVQIDDDLKTIARFLKWLNHAECTGSNLRTAVKVRGEELRSRADLIVRRSDGVQCALIIHFRKADKSPGGKSAHTSTKKDLYSLVTKTALEEKYPGIQTALIYLVHENDGEGSVGDNFIVTNTLKSNAFFERWDSLYEDGIFQREYALGLIADVLDTPLPKPCYVCKNKSCKKQTVSESRSLKPVKAAEESYKVPSFTQAQQAVVKHRDGPMLVCAGPGSGKTATVVGRIRELIGNGVPPEAILAITFTRDAAGELLRRCQSFCRSDEHPEVMTLNALGYKILRDNEGLLGRKVRLATKPQRLHVIEGLLSVTPKMAGYSYKELKGKNGLLAALDKNLSEYMSDPEVYLKKHQCDKAFTALAKDFASIMQAGGFISFDEQITLATKLMEDKPEVLDGLSRRYAYVMVDEYQDVDEAQVRFVYTLARHRNIVAVGDDDQAIYGFRGGSNRYMLSFKRDFPDAKEVVLTENFRSTGSITDAAQGLIRSNQSRISKEVMAVRETGKAVQVVHGRNTANLDEIIGELIKDGLNPGEIAVLASKNATLEELAAETSYPHVLGRAFLREDPVFRLLYGILSLAIDGIKEATVLSVLNLMGAEATDKVETLLKRYPLDGCRGDDTTVGKTMGFIARCISLIGQDTKAAFMADLVLQYAKVDESAPGVAISEMIEKAHLKSCHDLYRYMKDMIDFEDDTRVEPDTEGAVLFITSHESKGMEWKAVVMADDYRQDGAEETNRLYYVAMTRAKDRLYILTDGNTLLNQKGGEKAA